MNIIARTNLKATKRIVLSAHWDSRPFADEDSDPAKKKMPVLGADDSGSAIGTLLEIARQLQLKPLADIGVDFVLFDAEDYGRMRLIDFVGIGAVGGQADGGEDRDENVFG